MVSILRASDNERALADISINAQTREVEFHLNGFYDRQHFNSVIARPDSTPPTALRFRDIGVGGGSALIVHDTAIDGYSIIAPWRDTKALLVANRLDMLSGQLSTSDPILSSVLEVAEEIILVKNNQALVPQFHEGKFSSYNETIAETVKELAQQFGIPHTMEAAVGFARLSNPYALNGVPVALTFNTDENDVVRYVSIALEPVVYHLDTRGSLVFRESLGIETHGKVPERDVVEIDMDSTATYVYSTGRLKASYASFYDFLQTSGVRKDVPFTSGLHATIAGLSGSHELSRITRSLLREGEMSLLRLKP